jgi:pyridoxine 5-phosphate synthase
MPVSVRRDCASPHPVNMVRFERIAGLLMRAIGRSSAELSVLLTDDRRIAELNRQWLGRSHPTNVIAFGGRGSPAPDAGTALFGDIVMSVDTAVREAAEAGIGLEQRLEALLIHGLVHLLGEDHELGPAEARRMARKEQELSTILGKEKVMADLCINVDHVATIRQARGGLQPDPVLAAGLVELAGADGIVVHLREDRRHIQDRDVRLLRQIMKTRLTLEMAATDGMIGIAAEIRPEIVTLVPERREELTTEGGLDVVGLEGRLTDAVRRLGDAGIPVSLFVDPEHPQIEAAGRTGAKCVEIHTGRYAEARSAEMVDREFEQICAVATQAQDLGLRVHAGHGLDYRNTGRLAAVSEIEEFSIGHAVVARAVFVGLETAVKEMLSLVKRGCMV